MSIAAQLALAGALLVGASCRDVQKDPQYCEPCGVDASVTAPAQAQSMEGAGAESMSATGGILGSAGMSPAAISGGAGKAGNLAAAGSGMNASAGAAAMNKMDAGVSAGKDASTAQPDSSTKPDAAAIDAAEPPDTTAPSACGGPCPNETPACDETQRMCVECTQADRHACSGEKPVCDPQGKCVACTAIEAGACRGQAAVCELSSSTCVECTAARQDTCSGEKRACDTVKNVCAECTAAHLDTCVGDKRACDTVKNVCVDCTAAQPDTCNALGKHCLVQDQRCVACTEPAHCTDPANSSCDPAQHTCQPCSNNQDCAHIGGMQACDTNARRCVECTKATEAQRCPRNSSCDETTHHCQTAQTAPSGTRQVCDACVLDSDCISTAACQDYPGLGKFCFPKAQGNSCNTQPFSRVTPVTFDSGIVNVCLPAASCQAIQAASARTACTKNNGEQDDACGQRDGVCNDKKCSYRCGTAQECPASLGCRNGLCQ